MKEHQLFMLIGIVCSVWLLFRFLHFIFPYLLPSRLKEYHSTDAYALVTGSTDGIGKAIAQELAEHGFNLILHGRNPEKLRAVADEIKKENTKCKIVTLVHDGSKDSKLDVVPIIDLSVSILVNNVGIGPMGRFTKFSAEEIEEIITLNTTFPTQLTRSLLPLMCLKSLVLNVSSYAGLIPPPFLAVYAGTKAYNNAFSIGLQRELDNVEIISLLTGSVNTGSNKKEVTFMRPTARKYAKSVLNVVGCGRKSIMPYWPHAIQTFIMNIMPEKLLDKATKNAIKKELDLQKRQS
jgi:17beta-estradiol 17-dehydrogenase / very-long-chain 3-oxoacyl-CoA reductase